MILYKNSSIKLSILITVFIVISLSACLSEWQGDTAELIISVSSANRSTVYNPTATETHKKLDHEVTLTSEKETLNFTFKAGEALEAVVSPGNWNVRVDSYLNGDIYATGSKPVVLKLGQNYETIDMENAIKVSFNANGGNGSIKPIVIKVDKGSTPLPDGSGLSRTDYAFDGWNTNANGTGTTYRAGNTYNSNNNKSNVTLYAKWVEAKTVTFNSVTQDGNSTKITTQLTLTFNQAITNLSASDITLSGVTGVTKGTLSNSGTTYTLLISGFTSGGTLNVAVSKSGYAITPSSKTVTIYYYTVANQTPVVGDYTISGTGTFTYDGNTKTVTVTPKAGKSTGTVTVKYNGSTTAPSAVGTYPVTFDVAAANGWNAASGLSAGTLTIIESIKMVYVPGGSFQMGDVKNEGGITDLFPVHTVTLTGFYMGIYEVTQEQYQAVMGSNPSSFKSAVTGESGTPSKLPVEQVSWYDALVFCNKLSMMEGLNSVYSIGGKTDPADWGTIPDWVDSTWDGVVMDKSKNGYRLPTEAEWEYAAKGGNNSPGNYSYAGSDTIDDVAWYNNNSDNKTHEVGKKAPNGLGLYDMNGNVAEWCWDWYGDYSADPQTDPMGAVSSNCRIQRGGHWITDMRGALSSARGRPWPFIRDYSGFRLVRH